VAKHLAGSASSESSKVEPGQIQRSFHSLMREGRHYEIPAPSQDEVLHWGVEQEEQIIKTVPHAYAQKQTTLKNLDATMSEVRQYDKIPDGPTFHAWKYTAQLAHYRASQAHNPSPKVIAIDLDGCLYDFNSAMREWLVGQGWDRSKLTDPQVYAYLPVWGVDPQTWAIEKIKAIKSGNLWRSGETLEDGIAGTTAIGLAGHKLLINSARILEDTGALAARFTAQWLRENNINADQISIVGMDPKEKLKVEFDLIIDDAPSNVQTALDAGRKAVLLDRPWNRESTLPRATYPEIVANLDKYLHAEVQS
jgi:hypothetical protein